MGGKRTSGQDMRLAAPSGTFNGSGGRHRDLVILRSTCLQTVGVVAHGQDHSAHFPDHGSDRRLSLLTLETDRPYSAGNGPDTTARLN